MNRGLRHEGNKVTAQRELLKTAFGISSFGGDAEGELYVLDHRAGAVMRIVAPVSPENTE